MLQSGTYEKLAESNAKAINGLAPKISVWTTGAEGGDGTAHAGKAIADLYRALPPLLSTVQEQTGIVPPAWLAGMPAVEGANGYQAHADGPGKGKSG
jgi:flotillin